MIKTLGRVLSTGKQLPALWIGVVRPSARLILKMEALRFFETSVTVAVDKTWHPGRRLRQHCFEKPELDISDDVHGRTIMWLNRTRVLQCNAIHIFSMANALNNFSYPGNMKTSTGQEKLVAGSSVQLLLNCCQDSLFVQRGYVHTWA